MDRWAAMGDSFDFYTSSFTDTDGLSENVATRPILPLYEWKCTTNKKSSVYPFIIKRPIIHNNPLKF